MSVTSPGSMKAAGSMANAVFEPMQWLISFGRIQFHAEFPVHVPGDCLAEVRNAVVGVTPVFRLADFLRHPPADGSVGHGIVLPDAEVQQFSLGMVCNGLPFGPLDLLELVDLAALAIGGAADALREQLLEEGVVHRSKAGGDERKVPQNYQINEGGRGWEGLAEKHPSFQCSVSFQRWGRNWEGLAEKHPHQIPSAQGRRTRQDLARGEAGRLAVLLVESPQPIENLGPPAELRFVAGNCREFLFEGVADVDYQAVFRCGREQRRARK